MMPDTVSAYKQRASRFLCKLAVQTVRRSYRNIPLDPTMSELDAALGKSLSKLSQELTSSINSPRAMTNDSPLAGRTRFLHLEAARMTLGGGRGIRLSIVLGPLHVQRLRGMGVPAVAVATTVARQPHTFLPLPDLAPKFDSAFGASGTVHIISKNPIRSADTPYRVELTDVHSENSRKYVIVHNSGKLKGEPLKFKQKSTRGDGTFVYKEKTYNTAALALRALNSLNSGIPISSSSLSPMGTTSPFARVLVRYEVVFLDSGSTKEVYDVLDHALSPSVLPSDELSGADMKESA